MEQRSPPKPISTDLSFRDHFRRSFHGDCGTRLPRPSLIYLDFGQRMEKSTTPLHEADNALSSPDTVVDDPSQKNDDTSSSPDTVINDPGEPVHQNLRLQPETKELVHQILDVMLADSKVATALVCDIMGKLDEEAQLWVWQTCFRAMSDNPRKRIMDQRFLQ